MPNPAAKPSRVGDPSVQAVRLIEELAANAWPAAECQDACGWRMRHTPGSASRRINSVLPTRLAAATDVEGLIDACEAFYRRRGSPPRFQISPAAVPTDLDERLARRGYTIDAPTEVLTAPLDAVLSRCRTVRCPFSLESQPMMTDEWLDCFHRIGDRAGDSRQTLEETFRRIGPPAFFGLARREGQPIAVAVAVVEGPWGGLFSFATQREHRREGAAGGLLRALTERCRDLRADSLYLQVMTANTDAIRLYRAAGFGPAYRYQFRIRADAAH